MGACKTGCMIGDALVNHNLYADDLVVLSTSSAGLQQLLNVCPEYGVQHDIKYKAGKSVAMICRTNEDKHGNFPAFKLLNNNLTVCNQVKCLGHFISEQMTDDEAISRQR